MKNIVFLLIISAIFAISCGSYFNPKYYYNRHSSSNNGPGESEDIGGGGEGLEPKDDPFVDYDGSRPWNYPNYSFTMNFDDMVIQAEFDDKNRPKYKLVSGKWNQGDASKNEYSYNGDNTSAAGNNVSGVVYYLYKGKNPTFKPDTSYNQSDRLERFYFYRFTGSALGIVDLDNFLIAIDTYSKLVFAFAVPSFWDSVVGNAVPDEWSAVENGWEADSGNNSKIWFNQTDGIRYFYEYDPVGVVHSDGSIEIYDWCLSSIANNNKYAPRVDGNKIDLTREIAKEGSPGRSPYMPIKVSTKKDTVRIAVNSFKNIDMKSKKFYIGIDWGTQDLAYYTYSIGAAGYDNSIPQDYIKIVDLDPQPGLVNNIDIDDVTKLNIGQQIDFTDSQSFTMNDIDENGATIDLSSRIHKYNYESGFADVAAFGKHGSGEVGILGEPKIRLKYDSTQGGFVFDKENSIMSSTSTTAVITFDNSDTFILKKGETKEIVLKYTWTKGLNTSGESVEIKYTLTFENNN